MTATYTSSPSTRWIDYARLKLGDRDITDPLNTDEEIVDILALEGGDRDRALATLAQANLITIGQKPTRFTADGVTFDFSARAGILQALVGSVASAQAGGFRIRRAAHPQRINGGSEYS